MIGYLYRKYKFMKEFQLEKNFIFNMEGLSLSISSTTFFNVLKNQDNQKNVSGLFKEMIELHIQEKKLEKDVLKCYSELVYKDKIYGTTDFVLPDDFDVQLKIDQVVLLLLERFQEQNKRFSQLMCHSIEAYLNGNLDSINDILQNGSEFLYSDYMKDYILELIEKYKSIVISWNEKNPNNLLDFNDDIDYGIKNDNDEVLIYNKMKHYSDNFNLFCNVDSVLHMLENQTSIINIHDKEEFPLKIGKYINHNSFNDIEIIIPELYEYYTTISLKEFKDNKPVFYLNCVNLSTGESMSFEDIKTKIINSIE